MKKRIIVSVNCANDLAQDVPSIYTIVVDEVLARRIKELSKVLVDYSADGIETSNYAGTWSDACLFDLVPGESGIDDEALADALADIEEHEASIEIPYMQVSVRDFCFTAVPKHGGDDLTLTTLRIPISELDDDAPYICIE